MIPIHLPYSNYMMVPETQDYFCLASHVYGHTLSVLARIFSKGAFLTPCTYMQKLFFFKSFKSSQKLHFLMKLCSFWLKWEDSVIRHIFTHLQSLFHLSMQWGCNGGSKFTIKRHFRGCPHPMGILAGRCPNFLVSSCRASVYQKVWEKGHFLQGSVSPNRPHIFSHIQQKAWPWEYFRSASPSTKGPSFPNTWPWWLYPAKVSSLPNKPHGKPDFAPHAVQRTVL
jgi:hypothetical protein